MIDIEPLGNRVLILPDTGDHTIASSGLTIVVNPNPQTQRGAIIAKGEHAQESPPEGSVIIYAPSDGLTVYDSQGQGYLIMNDYDILAKVI